MNDHLALIFKKLDHLGRMQRYLDYSLSQTLPLIPITHWADLTAEQHETLAAFRVRFSEFQEHIGKTMRAVAREEEQELTQATPTLFGYFDRLTSFCARNYAA